MTTHRILTPAQEQQRLRDIQDTWWLEGYRVYPDASNLRTGFHVEGFHAAAREAGQRQTTDSATEGDA